MGQDTLNVKKLLIHVGGTKSSKHHLLITEVQSELFYGTEVWAVAETTSVGFRCRGIELLGELLLILMSPKQPS